MEAELEIEPELPQLPPPSLPPSRGSARLDGSKPPQFTKPAFPSQLNLAGPSSDLPVFSSDDVPADSENYSARRKKVSRVGPWWESSQQPRKKRKTEPLERNLDSGVFMNEVADTPPSDYLSSELDIMHDVPAAENQVENTGVILQRHSTGDENHALWGPSKDLTTTFHCTGEKLTSTTSVSSALITQEVVRSTDSAPATVAQTRVSGIPSSRRLRLRLSPPDPNSARHHPALEVVERAVENGVEDIDLSGRFVWQDPSLRDENQPSRIDDQIFHPLHHLVKTRSLHDPDRYDSLVPDMRLWLSGNELQSLPNEIYRLRNLTKLGLRGNKLRTLSPAIGRLERLQYLNLTGNRINVLPWEITSIPHLVELFVDSVHFYQPTPWITISQNTLKQDNARHSGRWEVLATSPIAWLDKAGLPIPKSPQRPTLTPSFDPSANPSALSKPPLQHSSRVVSLADMSLRAAAQCPDLVTLLSGPNATLIPAHLLAMLNAALQTDQTGGLECSICGRKFAIPRAEWIEWTRDPRISEPIPLIRTACAWECALDHVAKMEELNPPSSAGPSGSERTRSPLWSHGWTTGTTRSVSPPASIVANGLLASLRPAIGSPLWASWF